MKNLLRRQILRTTALAVSTLAFGMGAVATAQERASVKIGYALSLTGPNAGGTGITTLPNYQLWVKEVNDAGGLEMPDGKRLPIEVVEYDDRSSAEELVRALQRLATQDEVDFILPPWSTGYNLAAAPLLDRYGYPHLAATSVTDKAPEFAERWKKSFWMLGGGHDYTSALAKVLTDAAENGTINKKVAMISIADGFGIDLVNAARPSFQEAGLEVVYDKTYPVGTTDFTPMINEAKASGADTFVAFSYPPETFALTQQAQVADFNPKVLYFGVGTAFPIYEKNNGDAINGIMGIGGIDGTSEKIADYRKRHEAATGKAPDYWASVITYASLEILQEAIKRKGLDREAVAEEIASGTFETVLGETKLENNQLRDLWWAGQWQDGQFVAIAPSDRPGAAEPMIPRPAWKK
ncbi:amino acid ABC transporter substrate-binding protein [Pseudorhizobium flavum]|uniref:Branched-chain amino acid transport system substrate-binding protein n=1 Tax=Pseudorhizobium flavum TaxID=1335061 RepID=A0A7X0DEB1_9HYPH|nr:amino acid ABC transporter substrate-binding protein [Pseudorhizobium flavum]MBB6181742.1 branched-chain amino acid transport system substrate-binding protein [Pseudorhizobium flavum]CAD6616295.1 twin-arginine translocation pathway signal protein [Pseudorhizobium flavum]